MSTPQPPPTRAENVQFGVGIFLIVAVIVTLILTIVGVITPAQWCVGWGVLVFSTVIVAGILTGGAES